MARFFIHRPIFAIVIALIIVIMGTLAGLSLPVAQYPQISQPTINVSTTYIGANASVINQTVAQVIEEQVNGTQGMDYMNSTSDDSGKYSLDVMFNLGTDGDMDSVLVQNNVSIANADLPSDVQDMGVTTKKSSSDMSYMFSMISPNSTFSRTFLMNYANIYIVDSLKRIPGVGEVSTFGSTYSMRIWLNPDKLSELGLTITNVRAAIQEQNVQAPAGTIGQLPAPANQEKQYTGNLEGRLVTPEQFGNIIIKTNSDGSCVYLKDVARVETGAQYTSVICDTDGAPAAGFGIKLTDDANAMETIGSVKKVLEEASKDFPDDMTYVTIVDNTEFISESIGEVVETFKEALALVIIIVFIFLQSWRATLIPVLAIPVSLVGTFASFIILGFSINTLTLFAMVLAIGLVVDDAIVVVENVESHMQRDGLGPVEATEKAMDEVQGPVVAIAFVLSAVFIPVAFISGTTGVLYRQFALTIVVSMALSAFIALTLTPALCATIMKPHNPDEHKKNFLDKYFDRFNDWFERTQNRYTGGVAWVIDHAKVGLASLLIISVLAGFFFKVLPSTFVPDEDQGYYIVSLTMPEGTSLNRTFDAVDEFSKEVAEIPGVEHIMKVSGYDVLSSGTKSNAGTLFVCLNKWGERTSDDLSIGSIIRKTNITGRKHPEAKIMGFLPPSLPGLGMVGGWSMQLQDITGHTDQELDAILKELLAAANQRPELAQVYSTFSIDSPICKYDVDREKVKQMGVNLSDVFTALQVNYGGTQVNDFVQFGRTYKVMMQSDAQYRSESEALKFCFVNNKDGAMVPLDSLLTPKLSTSTSVITRFNGARSIGIQGAVADGYSSGQAIAAMEELVKEKAPAGFMVEWSGQSREEKKSSGSTGQIMLLSVVFVFLCLAALYESWSVPFAVLLSVPTGLFGAFFVQYGLLNIEALFGHLNGGLQNSVYMQIGVIMLMGLAAKNAILIVEFAKARVDAGMEPVKATIEAAGLRLRPILMTSLAFIIGCLPLALASGAGAAARNSMGTAVVGGMLFATCLGIFLIPVLYCCVVWLSDRLKKKKDTITDKTE
ncbi:RND efflux system, inner membrane transporter CmeB [Anaerovibrio sp. JC8]|uniref:efflux RND transporter permease subunit n=1 Tax=Anaerovibrio sp. JC8 TaxID=1240085 RepID=UPI000A0C589B|nr:multidrug efflux RND transporter permease subunit [Anaerovibrio sp. JC8]ORT99177.1 RND efflux system, inner membrane transporter CmeB [Anaerovibrio sp. JC8]